jgi:hypothetical protein
MQISQRSPSDFRPAQSLPLPRFGNGKVRLYADFDGTYFPGRDSEIRPKQAYFQNYFRRFSEFAQKAGKAMDFTVTTGRSLGSFQQTLRNLWAENIPVHLPGSLIVQDGGDEVLKAPSKPEHGFSWEGVNQTRRGGLVNMSGWDANAVRIRLKEQLKQEKIPFQEEIHGSLAKGQDPAERWGEGDPVIRISQEGPFLMKLHLKSAAIPNVEALRLKLEQAAGPGAHLSAFYRRDGHQSDLGLRIKPRVGHLVLGKHHDVGRAVEGAERKNDLVVAAGDWCNDATMLDPANYIPELRKLGSDPKTLQAAIAQSPELQERLKKLPFMAVAVYQDGGLDDCLKPLVEAYGEGPWRKVIQVSKGELVEGVQQAIREYRKQNPDFNAHLAPGIKVALGEEVEALEKRNSTQDVQPRRVSVAAFLMALRVLSRWLGRLLMRIGKSLLSARFSRFRELR